jgi:hypothetical protein
MKYLSILHTAVRIAPDGDEAMAHVLFTSALAKLLPDIVTKLPTRTFELGVRVMLGTTVNGALPLSPRRPVTVTADGSVPLAPDVLTTKEPVNVPGPVTEQEGAPSIHGMVVIVQLESPELNAEPVTVIVCPPVPLLAESDTIGDVTVKVSDTEPWTTAAFVSVNMCAPAAANGLIVKLPVRIPLLSILQPTLVAGSVAFPKGDGKGTRLDVQFVTAPP